MLHILGYMFSRSRSALSSKAIGIIFHSFAEIPNLKYPLLIVPVLSASLLVAVNIKYVVCWWKQ